MRHLVRLMLCSMGILSILSCRSRDPRPLWTANGQTMGTTYQIKAFVADSVDQHRLENGIEEILFSVNQQMSTWIDSSVISRFNRSNQTGWFYVSDAMARLFAQALSVSAKSTGAFDITVAPLVDLWGFGSGSGDRGGIPSEAEIQYARARVGYHMLQVRAEPPAIRKLNRDLRCDLGAIAKGYAVDRVAEFLESAAVEAFFVEIGGEVRTCGAGPHNGKWHIGIASPRQEGGIQRILRLTDASVATSGDYMNYFENDGVRYSHTIDPRTGRPIAHRLGSVTVVHPSCLYADAMATAIDVLGPIEGYQLAVRENLAALLIVRDGDDLVEKMTPAFSDSLGLNPF
ncbi:FAD:protein FMN transferase [candidate division KSB1 bacterium]|nr:FAD:protein FMN transferase [candidate division KSB1 bacterium]